MRSLPNEVVHRPFDSGPFRMAMDLVTIPEADWFEFDQKYPSEMAERRRLLDNSRDEVFGAMPKSADARREALDLITAALVAHHPNWFSQDGAILRNRLTAEDWDTRIEALTDKLLDPLELAGRLVQEDLCLIQNTEAGPAFTAAVLCFPSRWRLMDKLGKVLSAVHAPVPLYEQRLAAPVDRFMRHLKPGHIVSRLNWSLLDDPALFQPGGKWRVDADARISPLNAGQRIFLRVERQTLRRMPVSQAVLFGIRVHVYPLDRVIDGTNRATALAAAVRALPAEIQHYKSLRPFRTALLSWLEQAG